MLQDLLTTNGGSDVRILFGVHELSEAIAPCKAIDHSGAMLMYSPDKIARNAYVERSVGLIRHDVNPAAGHHATSRGALEEE
jgi:hypothetical protein